MIFNRPESTRAVFAAIRRARPSKLLIIADGPREQRPEDIELCRQAREVVSNVDWDCEVLTNFSTGNLGCRNRVVSGLNWAFSLVEEAIILEDDCLPDATFFPFCEELLQRYRDDRRVIAIAGTNLIAPHMEITDSYYFCKIGSIWGWATWSSRWAEYDEHLKRWPALREANALQNVFDRPKDIRYWKQIFQTMYEGNGPHTWDYQWSFVAFFGNQVMAVPRVNLIENIGFGADATHTTEADPRNIVPVVAIEFPLKHPLAVLGSIRLEHLRCDLQYMTLYARVVRKFKKIKERMLKKFRNETAR
jgi:hypothetical protein